MFLENDEVVLISDLGFSKHFIPYSIFKYCFRLLS